MADTSLRRKVGWLIAIRAVISTLLLGTATFAQITAPGSFQVDPFFFLIGLTYALTISYAAALRLVDRYRWLVDVQLGGDALIVSAFIYFTGGITSYFSSLYVLPIVAASTLQARRLTPMLELNAARPRAAQIAAEGVDYFRRQLEHLVDRAADHGRRGEAGNHLGRAIEGEDSLGVVRGGQSAWQAVDDVLVERLQVRDVARRLRQLDTRRSQAFGE